MALVESYLRVNGYLTVTEYPVVEAMRYGEYRTATDVDILAFRFPGAGRLVSAKKTEGHDSGVLSYAPDPGLGCDSHQADMLIGEVKEGRADFNRGAREPAVGSAPGEHNVRGAHVISLGHVRKFLEEFVQEHWNVLRQQQLKDPALGFLLMFEKASRGMA